MTQCPICYSRYDRLIACMHNAGKYRVAYEHDKEYPFIVYMMRLDIVLLKFKKMPANPLTEDYIERLLLLKE